MDSPCKNKDSGAKGMRKPAFAKFSILHWNKEVSEPAQFAAVKGCIKLIPENQRQLVPQSRISNTMKGSRQFFVGFKLREIEFELAQSAWHERPGHFFNRKGFPGTWRAEHCKRERPDEMRLRYKFGHDVSQTANIFDLGSIHRGPATDSL